MAKTNDKTYARARRRKSIRKVVSGTADKPRLSVFRSSKHIYAQLIDDVDGRTLASASSLCDEVKGGSFDDKKAVAKAVGELVAERAKAANITQVVFDRGGYLYHGRVAALADGARDGGLQF